MTLTADTLARFGLRDPEAAAEAIAELAESIFGPFDPEVAEGWALSVDRDLGAADLRAILAEAASAPDPLAFLLPLRDAPAMLERRMRWRWASSRRARALGHPPDLQGQTWASLSAAAQGEVRQNLTELAAYEDGQVRRHRPKDHGLDTFLSELAEIYVRHTGRTFHPSRLTSNPQGRFIMLAEAVLSGLPALGDGKPRVAPDLRSARGLASRWQRLKARHRLDPGE